MNSQTDFGALAHTAEQVAAEWGFVLERPFMLSNYSYVAPAGDEAVMKVTSVDDDESDEEADALALWDGDGAVRLLRQDREHRCLLLERARPGSDISGLPDDEATRIAVSVGLRAWSLIRGAYLGADEDEAWVLRALV